MQNLSFDVSVTLVDGVNVLDVAPLVDGTPLQPRNSLVFDALTLLALGTTELPSEVYLFNCSCGVPGCAGLDRPARLFADESCVTWEFPASEMADRLDQGLYQVRGDVLHCRFDRPQYEAALHELTQRLATWTSSTGCRIWIGPGSFMDASDGWEASQTPGCIEDIRSRMREWRAREDWRERTWGELVDARLFFRAASGEVAALGLEWLADLVLEARGVPEEQRAVVIEAEVAPLMRQGTAAVEAFARTLSWPQFMEHACDEGPAESRYGEAWEHLAGLQAWPAGALSVELASSTPESGAI
ncbi:hypothetical protein D3C71_24030 [compost metagenome]